MIYRDGCWVTIARNLANAATVSNPITESPMPGHDLEYMVSGRASYQGRNSRIHCEPLSLISKHYFQTLKRESASTFWQTFDKFLLALTRVRRCENKNAEYVSFELERKRYEFQNPCFHERIRIQALVDLRYARLKELESRNAGR